MEEKKILYVSVIFSVFFALSGIIYGIMINSSMVMFDGVYSVISVILSLLSIAVLKQVKPGSENELFPFGKWHLEPAFVVFKSLIIITLCIYSFSTAISGLISGGNDVKVGMALIYAVISFALCLFVYLYIRSKNRLLKSDLLLAESTQWLGDTLLSLGVVAGFGLAFLLIHTRYNKYVPLMDPLMVVIASVLFIFFPVKSLLKSLRQLIFIKAEDEIFTKIKGKLNEIALELNAKYKVHLVRVGHGLFLEVNFLTVNTTISVEKMDQIRESIESEIKGNVWLNINITTKQKWL